MLVPVAPACGNGSVGIGGDDKAGARLAIVCCDVYTAVAYIQELLYGHIPRRRVAAFGENYANLLLLHLDKLGDGTFVMLKHDENGERVYDTLLRLAAENTLCQVEEIVDFLPVDLQLRLGHGCGVLHRHSETGGQWIPVPVAVSRTPQHQQRLCVHTGATVDSCYKANSIGLPDYRDTYKMLVGRARATAADGPDADCRRSSTFTQPMTILCLETEGVGSDLTQWYPRFRTIHSPQHKEQFTTALFAWTRFGSAQLRKQFYELYPTPPKANGHGGKGGYAPPKSVGDVSCAALAPSQPCLHLPHSMLSLPSHQGNNVLNAFR